MIDATIQTSEGISEQEFKEALSRSQYLSISGRHQKKAEKAQRKIRVFVSYSHQDKKYLGERALLGYLKSLEHENFEFWSDQKIPVGAQWDDVIRKEMASADIALVLVSHAFLNSPYCRNVEIASFIEDRKKRGLRIIPVILSACDWKSYGWLSSTQAYPREGQNIESNFKDRGKRLELYLEVLEALRKIGQEIALT